MEKIGNEGSRSYLYDETNRMAEGTNWKGDRSAYTYNGLGLRANNTQTTHTGKVYARDYVIDYTSFENDDLMVFAEGNRQLEYEQKHVYAGSERTLQFTDKGAGAALILTIGVAAVIATGGSALPAVVGLFAGSVTASTAIVTVATLAAGIASVSFGFADVLEALQDLSHGLKGSSKASFNPLRDTLFTGNEDLYYRLEMAATLIASVGTATFYNFNMESEINASKNVGYGTGSPSEGSSVFKGNLTGSLNKLITDEKKW